MNLRTAFSCSALGALLWATPALAQPTNVNLTCNPASACTGLGTLASPYSIATNTFNCSRTQSFLATATGAGSKVWTLTSASPAGYSTTPAGASTVTNSLTSATFSRTMNRVSATARCAAGAAIPGATNLWSLTVSVRFNPGTLSNTKQIFYRTRDTTAGNMPNRFCACDSAVCITGSAAQNSATDNCDLNPGETRVGAERRTSLNCAGNYNLARDWNVVDCNAAAALRTQTITVRDFTPPVVQQNLSEVACLWPPNHDMVFFSNSSFPIVATDNCSGVASRALVGCVSSQPDPTAGENQTEGCSGDGNTGPDCMLAAGGLDIRSERCGDVTHPDEGRDYQVRATASDGCGNISPARTIGIVGVPHDEDDQTTTECISAE